MSAVRISAASADETPHSAGEPVTWPKANQAYLVMEFARLRRGFAAEGGAGDDDAQDAALRQLRLSLEPPPAIDQLSAVFGLSDFERQLVLLAAGVELDSALAAQCSQAMHREHRVGGAITFSLALGALADPHWSALAPTGPLRRYRLVELEAGQGLTAAALRIDERILHYLVGVNRLDARLEALLQTRGLPRLLADEHAALANDLVAGDAPVLHLCGDDPRGQEDLAALLADRAGRQLYVLPIESLASANDAASLDPAASASLFLSLWAREAALLPAALLIQCGSHPLTTAARQLIERLPSPLAIASRDALRLDRQSRRLVVDKPSPASQTRLWAQALCAPCLAAADAEPEPAARLQPVINTLAAQFRLSAEAIGTVAAGVAAPLQSSNASIAKAAAERLWSACRSISRPRLEDLAERIVPAARWDDLILPGPQKDTLRQLSAQARNRLTVYESWGFAARGRRGLGISALFAGVSGTGKTLAAEVLAAELRLDLFRIDLSAVVSKYIGESEKNLKQVFDAAEEGGVLLLFDEADALFGKRAEVKDSHDRYANIEVSYLLQRMESFQGVAVLTTNLKSSLDKAFQRRLRFAVDFPFPGPLEREAIWRRIFPAAAPAGGLDIKRLAQLNMTGGNIRNIALNAAFLAAEAGGDIEMAHVLQATRQEAIKTERTLAESEIRGWA